MNKPENQMNNAAQAMESAAAPRTTPATVEQMLKAPQYLEAIHRAIPQHMTPEKVASFALNALRKTPKLAKCDPVTLFGSIITCSQNGWEIGKDCHLLPFENRNRGTTDVNIIPDYRGAIKLAIQSDQVSKVEAHVVHENDLFDFELGMNEVLRHKPAMRNRGEFLCVYAIVTLSDGNKQYEVMTFDDIMDIKRRSKSGENGPWVTDFGMMARKTAIKRVLRYVGSSTEAQKLFDIDTDSELGRQNNRAWYDGDDDIIEGEVVQQKTQEPANETRNTTSEKAPAKRKPGRPRKQQAPASEQAPVDSSNAQAPDTDAAGHGQAGQVDLGPGGQSSANPLTFAKVAEGINNAKTQTESQSYLNSAAGVLPQDQISELASLHVNRFGSGVQK